jgi:hypothetical protein
MPKKAKKKSSASAPKRVVRKAKSKSSKRRFSEVDLKNLANSIISAPKKAESKAAKVAQLFGMSTTRSKTYGVDKARAQRKVGKKKIKYRATGSSRSEGMGSRANEVPLAILEQRLKKLTRVVSERQNRRISPSARIENLGIPVTIRAKTKKGKGMSGDDLIRYVQENKAKAREKLHSAGFFSPTSSGEDDGMR